VALVAESHAAVDAFHKARLCRLFASGARWAAAAPLPGAINTSVDEFDATFVADGTSIVFARVRKVPIGSRARGRACGCRSASLPVV